MQKNLPALPAETHLPAARSALALVDAGLLGVIFVAPLFLGGRSPLGALVYVAIVCAMTTAWCVHQAIRSKEGPRPWRRSAADALLLAGLGLLLLQVVPLPAAWLGRLAPGLAELLPVWHEASHPWHLGSWSTLSLTPAATKQGIAVYLAHAMLFLVLVQRMETVADIERILRWMAIGCAAMAVLGLAGFLFSNGKYLWIYEHPFRNTSKMVKGPFYNQNHFAHMLALGIGPLLWWLVRSRLVRPSLGPAGSFRTARRPAARSGAARGPWSGGPALQPRTLPLILFGLLGVVALAGMLTFSRGGMIVIFSAASLAVVLYCRQGLLGKAYLAGLPAIALFVAVGLSIYGHETVSDKMNTIATGDLDEIDANSTRRDLWDAALAGSRRFPLFGTGVGSHPEFYPIHFEERYNVEFTHAESSYLHLLLEAGWPALLLVLSGIALCGTWCLRCLRKGVSPEVAACGIAVAAALLAGALHSIWDFVWLIPACMSWGAILAACGCRASQIARQGTPSIAPPRAGRWKKVPRPAANFTTRGPWILATAASIGMALAMIGTLRGPARAGTYWDQYLKAGQAEHAPEHARRHLDYLLARLDRVVQNDPNDARGHLTIASRCLEQFAVRQNASENPIDLTQIRSAALASRFPSRAELDRWLEAAIGENRHYLDRAKHHALKALELCPLQGEAYVYLADLAFLHGAGEETSKALLEQALLVRPHRGTVHFAVGSHAALAGDAPRMISHWKIAFRQDPRLETRIISQAAPLVGGEFFVREFQPGIAGLRQLYDFYRAIGRDDDARIVAIEYVQSLELQTESQSRRRSANLWRQAARVYEFLEQKPQVLQAYANAVYLTPDDFQLRRQYAAALLDQDMHEEALRELEWCLLRQPDDRRARNLALRARRVGLTDAPSAAATISTDSRHQ